MLFGSGIEDFIDDGFEGSKLERSIFREIFFSNDVGITSKKCLVTGAINFECESSRNADTSICSNSETSAITSHSSSKSTRLEGLSNVTEELRVASEPENLPKTSTTVNQNGEEVSGKEIKSPVYELPNAKPDLGKVSSAFHPATDPVSEVVTLRLVECSSQGLTSSCYLLKQHGEIVRGITLGDPHVSKCRSLSLEGNEGKEVVVGKTIASPVSQESIASRLFFAASPTLNVQERTESTLHALERPQEPESFELDISDLALKENLKKDPRPVLQYHVVGLLSAAGWHIERRKRPSRQYMESVYKMPNGRSVREFAKAWRFCGELLLADRYSSVGEQESKQWSSMGQFLSDLSDTLAILDKETNRAELAYRWSLLDPFVAVALINRKIGALRKGEVVKATHGPVKSNRESASLQIAKGDQKTSFSGSGESALVAFEGHSLGCYHQSASSPPATLPVDGTVSTVVRLTSCLCDVSFHQDGSTECQICDKPNSDRNVETTNEVSYLENNDGLPGQVADVEHHLLKSGDECPNSTTQGLVPFQGLVVARRSMHDEEEDRQGYEGSQVDQADSFSPGDVVSKKKTRRKSKRLSEMEPSSLHPTGNPVSTSADEAPLPSDNGDGNHLEPNQEQGDPVANTRTRGPRKKSLNVNSSSHQIEKKGSGLKRKCSTSTNSKIVKKKSMRCHIEDDDLLVSAIIKNKDFSPGTTRRSTRKNACKSKAWRKRKSKKRTCRLRPSVVDGGKHLKDGKWYSVGVRTVLSWLVSTDVLSLNDVIQYRNPQDNAVVKDGLITRDGILCKCCSELFTVSAFKIHAGFKLNRPCLNLFMESGKPFTICQLQAWSDEYKTRKGGAPAVKVDNDDQNDDSCGHCGDGGELLCCDNCPSTFHQACLPAQDLPEGSWYCPNCACWMCGSFVNDKDISSASCGSKCSQCEHKYHESCLKETGTYQAAILSDAWFCGRSCLEVYSGLQSRVGVNNIVANEFTWALLKCIHDDQKVHSAQRFALKAECNSRLSVALTIMEECFLSMVDPRTGIDMIPHVIYNWGSNFSRLNFQGFYTVVLEKDDVLISVASIRIHGTTVAEMPLIATCSKYRRQGMCRILVTQIEEMLRSVRVEKIVVAAIPDLVETWTKGFGFELVEEIEKVSLGKINLMVFPGTVLLKKHLYDSGNNTHEQSGDASGLTVVEPTKVDSVSSKMERVDESKEESIENHCTDGACSKLETDVVACEKTTELECGSFTKVIGGELGVDGVVSSVGVEKTTEVGIRSDKTMIKSAMLVQGEGKVGLEVGAEVKSLEPGISSKGLFCQSKVDMSPAMQVDEWECDNLRDQFSKMSCEDLIPEVGNSEAKVASNVESLGMYDETQISLGEKLLEKGCDVNGS